MLPSLSLEKSRAFISRLLGPYLPLSTPAVGSEGVKKVDKVGLSVGIAILAAGLVVNERVIADIASPDGRIELTLARAGIWSVDILLVLIGAFLIKHPRHGKVALLCVMPFVSLALSSLVIFAVLESFPSLIRYTKLDYAHYYALKSRFIPDDDLVFRNRPLSSMSGSLVGDEFRQSYHVSVVPVPYTARFDEYGFRNRAWPAAGWDVVVLGDSYVEFGVDEDDTFTSRFAVLSGLTVRNLGTGSYGPFHYLTVLKRYGLSPKPKYILFCFTENNDIADIADYLLWKTNGRGYGTYDLSGKTFLQRYVMALKDVVYAPLTWLVADERPANDLVSLHIGDSSIKAVFTYKNDERTPAELLQLNEWRILRELMLEFKNIATENRIVPMILFFPTKAHIYAEYSTSESSTHWLTIRERQIAAKANVEMALRTLCRDLGIELISFSSAFERAASHGKMLYYPFDSHWNAEGRQVAATVLAARLGANAKDGGKRRAQSANRNSVADTARPDRHAPGIEPVSAIR